ncbi:hypothetical protein KIMH_04430 [Bombiscardovia apis]|uniref:Major facilitator superfamily (MFS) profile domain-containing protein n=1 Tax=Bombiscardovia apis TaxID=2932182 RepID=A0ABM8BBQ8_9BIFI|nr:MFS transporter [Bombiscardovia apis]BDR54332.1 hypothetical protein KIMH_04430 [Bombiscardovia apis]
MANSPSKPQSTNQSKTSASSLFSKATIGVLIGIFVLAVVSRFDANISPSVAKIQESFPNEDPSKVESIVSIGSSAAMVSAVIFGKLLERLSFRFVGITACLFVSVGGLLPIVMHDSVNELLFFAIVVGFGVGIITTMLPSLEAHFFHGKQLSTLMGWNLAVQNGASMVIMYVGGLLALQSWVYNYWLYAIAVLALIPVFLFVPAEKVTDDSSSADQYQLKAGARQSTANIVVCELLGFLSIFLVAVMYNKLAV